nr:MAG TPA: hypothetical protein [Caudoviricetes sp.]
MAQQFQVDGTPLRIFPWRALFFAHFTLTNAAFLWV